MAQEYPTLNEVAPSWSDLSLSFPMYGGDTVKLTDIAAVKWSDSVEMGMYRGTNGGRKSRRTTGQYDCECTVTFYKAGWVAFQEALAALNPKISLVGFDILIQHTPPGSAKIFTVKVTGCRIAGRSADMAEGSDADQIEVAMNPMLIEDDGVTLL